MILFNNPKSIYDLYKNEILKKIKKTLDSGIYINSKELKSFERNFSKYLNMKHSIGVGNATDAIYLSLKCLGIKKNDEVLTTSHTAAGTLIAISNTGAKPKFVDIDLENFNMNLNLLEKKINNKTKAIIIVHLYGQSADMNKLKKISKKYKLPIIEDCSQAAGSKHKNKKLGSFGDLSCFSFFPTKNLSAFGDGGLICTNNGNFAKKIKYLREYGWDNLRNTTYLGINSRLDELQAAILNIKLKYLDKNNFERAKIAQRYSENINNKNILLPKISDGNDHVFHLYVIRIKKRNKLLAELLKNKIFAGIHYKKALHQQKLYKEFKNENLPNTNRVVKEVLSLPIYPGLTIKEQDKVINIINKFK